MGTVEERREPAGAPSAGKRGFLKSLGPGLITGAADDDPSGIATYSQAGAQFGYQLGWTLILTYPLMVSVQDISARIGRITGRGIAGNILRHYPAWVLYVIVTMLTLANVCNIGADLGAMAASAELIGSGVPSLVYLLFFAAVCAGGQIFLPRARYVGILKWLTMSLFAYCGALLLAHVSWRDFFAALVMPSIPGGRDAWLMVVAILGTTISPYLFFWQASQEAEDTKTMPKRRPLHLVPAQARDAFSRIRLDTLVGMGISNLVALAIIGTCAATLHRGGGQEIQSAAQAAEALRPVAGPFAAALFALGIIGTGLMSVPILAGSAAYAIGEARQWPVGMGHKPRRAKAFYAAMVIATLLGAAANVAHISPVKALIWSAVLNAVVSAPVMVLIMLMASSAKTMKQFAIPRLLGALGWCATLVMAASSLVLLIESVR